MPAERTSGSRAFFLPSHFLSGKPFSGAQWFYRKNAISRKCSGSWVVKSQAKGQRAGTKGALGRQAQESMDAAQEALSTRATLARHGKRKPHTHYTCSSWLWINLPFWFILWPLATYGTVVWHSQDQQLVLSEGQSVLEGPVAEKKKWGMKKNKEERNREIWGCAGGWGRVDSWPFARDLRDCPLSEVTKPPTRATVRALSVGGGLQSTLKTGWWKKEPAYTTLDKSSLSQQNNCAQRRFF